MSQPQPVDLELKKAFMELQVKMVDTSKKIRNLDAQLDVLKRLLEFSELAENEMKKLPNDTKTYESVGRMFLLKDLEEIKSNLKDRQSKLKKNSSDLENSKEYLEKNLKDSENNLREMVQQRRELTDAK
ncbi:hypothetical protein K1T71_015103 [Dendrolimus kikuchii]|nr:hypothetical protein K1T71_015103 [Dendrolimus kikuchii]